MAKLPYLRMYVGDLLSDDKMAGLSLNAWGAWVKVLMVMWKAQATPVQKTHRAWCNIFCCDQDELESVIEELEMNSVGHLQVDAQFISFHSPRIEADIDSITKDRERKRETRSAPKFEAPGIEEVQEHFKEKGSDENEADKFWNYYESVGWEVGRSGKKMKNWKSAATNWIKRADDFKPHGKDGMTYQQMVQHAKKNRLTAVKDYRQEGEKWYA